jgi:low temperature requirement protein LtrA
MDTVSTGMPASAAEPPADADAPTSDQYAERVRVTPLELLFDLVVVFAITQVATFLARNPTWGGLLRGLLLLGVLWWAWSAYAWLTNALDPEQGAVRLAMFAAIAAMLIMSLAVPRAFGRDGVIFGVAYFVARGLQLVLFAIAGRGDHDLLRAVIGIAPGAVLGASLLVVAGFLSGRAEVALWASALAITLMPALLNQARGFRIAPEHFVERYGLIIIIALGESITAIGVGAAGLSLDAGEIAAALLGLTVVACLWWSYFDWVVFVTQARLAEATGAQRAAFARDAYAFLHMPMVAGIVLFAFGLKTTLADAGDPLGSVAGLGLCGGAAAYLLAHVALRLRIGGGIGRGRPIAAVLLLALIPVAREVPALAALALVASVCVGLIVYEVERHRDARAWIRERRGAFSVDEAREANRAADRPRQAASSADGASARGER